MANLRVDKITSTETFETTGSVQFDGVDDGLTISDNAAFDLGTGDFTIEGWYYLVNAGAYKSLMDWRGSGGDGNYPALFRNNTGNYIYYYVDSAERISNVTINYNTWFHVTVCRSSGITRLFIDGKEKGSFADTISYVSRDILLGLSNINSNDFTGNISNYRVIKGKALYTSNFKPPMRELEVTAETVLLACQSKTDATLEKTGKTITANGNAVANELTPGLLTPIVKSGGGSAITGSVEFDGTGDYLSIANNTDFNFGTGDFTVECFIHVNKHLAGATDVIVSTYQDSSNGWTLGIHGSSPADKFYFGIAGDSSQLNSSVLYTDSWVHLAAARSGSTAKFFINGVEVTSASNSTNQTSTSDLHIGTNVGGGALSTEGFISNLRVVKGTALYTDSFTPPTRELKRVPGTVLLCCQDENSVTTEVTGKTITSNGDPAASNFTPQVGDDRQVTFEGVTKINSDAYFCLPTGDTASREATGTYNAGTRGVMMGGIIAGGSTKNATIDYWTMASTGNALDFGDCTAASGQGAGVASRVRGVNAGGFTRSTANFDYVTIMSTGNALDFGDLPFTHNVSSDSGFSSETRGLFHQGLSTGPTTYHNIIDYITISSTGNAQDFGDTTYTRNQSAGLGSPTRGVWAGGYTPSDVNSMDYVTIASTGNALDFGDLTYVVIRAGGSSNATRGVFLGGKAPALTNAMSYITIATTGNGQDFGDLIQAQEFASGTSSSTRGVKVGGSDDSPGPYAPVGTIEYFEIATTGNTQAFGDLSVARARGGTFSNGHGGLG